MIVGFTLVALLVGFALGRHYPHPAPGATTPEQAWDSGWQHAMTEAHRVVTHLPKPWITYGEERGYDLARTQLADALAATLETTHPNVTHDNPGQASCGGVS